MRFTILAMLIAAAPLAAAEPKPIKILFLGDDGHHRPAERFRQLQPVFATRGIDLVYTDKPDALNPGNLARYDGLLLYANIDAITPDQEKALLDFVEGGKGFIPLHCASYCFRNSDKVVALIGAQFLKHETATFRTELAKVDHPILKGFTGFESFDETYVHTKHNEKDRTVLEYRVEKGQKEPWTWVRTQGKGRVFYTAWGHDERTWGNPGFQNLVERGVRWAVGADLSGVPDFTDKVAMTPLRKDLQPFEYMEANVPFYPPTPGGSRAPLKKMQKPLEPAESAKHIVTPLGFEAKLFVSEPQIHKPICMAWDERGRLWVAESFDYPNEKQPRGKGHDRITICEDTDGDGVADKFTVFADNLSIPTSITFANGGIIVQQAPDTLFLKSSKGDDKADIREVLFTGWGTSDTHAGPSNLQYGPDNWIYGMVGYAGFDGTVGGEKHHFSQGFYRFKPDGSKLEFIRNTSNNSWGVGFNEEGILFGSTANGCASVHMPIPNRYYERVHGWSPTVLAPIIDSNKIYPITDKIRQVDWHGGFTAAAGHAIYTARTYPRAYWDKSAFVAEPTGHLLATLQIQASGTEYHTHYGWNLLASDDEWTAPIMAEVGPDGNVWVIDWYNYIVQHNPTPQGWKTGKGNAYETELRDKKHARIYRIVWKDGKQPAPMSLDKATPEQLVAALKNDNMFWRRHAQRLLVERGKKDVVSALFDLVQDDSVDEMGQNVGAMHALCTLQGLGVLDGKDDNTLTLALSALRHKSPGVRRNAAMILPPNRRSTEALFESRLLADSDFQVKLAAFLALADMPISCEAGDALAEQWHNTTITQDRWLHDALITSAATHDVFFLRHAAAEKASDLTPTKKDVLKTVALHFGRGASVRKLETILTPLAHAAPEVAEVVFAGLAQGWPSDVKAVLSEEQEKLLLDLLPKLSPAGQGDFVRLTRRWGSKSFDRYAADVAAKFLEKVRDEKASDADRVSAAVQYINFRPTDAAAALDLLKQVAPAASPELSEGILRALGRSESPELAAVLISRLGSFTPSARNAAIRVLVSRSAWTGTLLAAAEKGEFRLSDLSLDQQRALASHPDRDLAKRARALLEKGGSLPNPDRQKICQELMPLTTKSGDAAAGFMVFKTHCAKCHIHGSEGNRIGPDLTGMAVHTKAELLDDIIDPSRNVEGNYRQYTLSTTDGRVIEGLLASETKTSVELIDTEAKRHAVLREDIDSLRVSPKSLMPDGFEKQIKPEEFVNLLEFLTAKGKYVVLPLEKAATVVSTKGMFFGEDSTIERIILKDWTPRSVEGVPFQLVEPRGDRNPNVVMLYGPQGSLPPKMPKSVTLPCNMSAKAIHMLSGISGWGYPASAKGTVSMIVRLHYEDGKTEDHALKNGEHFADYIRRVDVPGSKFAFAARSQQVRYLSVSPERNGVIKTIELVKGPDDSAPLVLAVTVESR